MTTTKQKSHIAKKTDSQAHTAVRAACPLYNTFEQILSYIQKYNYLCNKNN